MTDLVRKFLATWIVLIALNTGLEAALMPSARALSPAGIGWLAAQTAVEAAILGWLSWRARGGRRRVGLALLALYGGAIQFNMLFEAFVFGVITTGDLARMGVMSAALTAVVVPALAGLNRGADSAPTPAPWSSPRILRNLLMLDVAYLFIYFAAGLCVAPIVVPFYQNLHLPSFGTMAAVQLLVRGPVFVLAAWSLAGVLPVSRAGLGIAVGLAFSLLGGVAPLIAPSPFFPDYIRLAHLAEAGISNFLYGFLCGWVLHRARGRTPG